MKRITTIIVAFCAVLTIAAQNATDKVQQHEKGKGTVTVTQSSAINDLVNNKGAKQSTTNTSTAHPQQPVTNNSSGSNTTVTNNEPSTEIIEEGYVEDEELFQETESSESKARNVQGKKKPVQNGDELDAENLKTHENYNYSVSDGIKGPKIVRGKHKARGWRILVYTGGNKRVDRQKAQEAGKKVKKIYPGIPVYTHFYTPRWMTYCGNFHDHKEAEKVKKELVKNGFTHASIVKTQIIVE